MKVFIEFLCLIYQDYISVIFVNINIGENRITNISDFSKATLTNLKFISTGYL